MRISRSRISLIIETWARQQHPMSAKSQLGIRITEHKTGYPNSPKQRLSRHYQKHRTKSNTPTNRSVSKDYFQMFCLSTGSSLETKPPTLKKPTPQPSNKPYIIKHVIKKIKVKCSKYKNLPQTPTKQTQQAVYSENDLQIMLLGTCKVVFKALSSLAQKDTQTVDAKIYTSETMMSIWRRSFLRVFISCSGSLCIPTQQPLTNILVALERGNTNRE